MEGDGDDSFVLEPVKDFNPLPPYGGRLRCEVI